MSTTAPASPSALFADLDRELAATRRVLARVPFEQRDWRPHPKSMTLGRLAVHLAELPRLAHVMATTAEVDMAATPPTPAVVTTRDELLALFDGHAATMRAVIATLDAPRLAERWRLRAGDRVLLDAPRAELLREHGVSHPVHHRAQLTVYLRMLDVPVPALYGPSADEP